MRCSIHIDAGYLYSALATRLTGSANRAAINVDEPALVQALVEIATADSGMRLLRVLWYDAAKDGIPNPYQRRIGLINSVKLRMGRINPYGEQKGVDLRLGLDLVSLGVNSAAEVAYLVSGDDDLTEAVSDAQDLGLQVKLIVVPGLGGVPISVAANLSLAVDGVMILPDNLIEGTVSRLTAASPVAAVARPVTAASAPVIPPRRPVGPPVVPSSTAQPQSAQPPAALPQTAQPPTAQPPTAQPPTAQPALPVIPPTRAPTGPAPVAVPVYSSTTGVESAPPSVIDHELIVVVAQSVFDVWSTTASAEEVAALRAGKPNVPPQIDRILLVDLVNRSGVSDIPTYARNGLRDAFWQAAGKR